MSELMKISNMYSLDETIAAPLFEGHEYPWELLPLIKDFIIELGKSLPSSNQPVPIMLCIAVIYALLPIVRSRTVRRHGIEPPMDEYAEFGVFKPLRDLTGIYGFPIRRIVLGTDRQRKQKRDKSDNGSLHFK